MLKLLCLSGKRKKINEQIQKDLEFPPQPGETFQNINFISCLCIILDSEINKLNHFLIFKINPKFAGTELMSFCKNGFL